VFSSNSGDLKLLEVLVVTNITAFYTYMKAARDLLGELAKGPKSGTEAWNNTVTDLISVLFLGYERARKAVNDLIEFQPVQDENKIVILITELECYVFLRKQFDGVRLARLRLRERTYTQEVPVLYSRVMSHKEGDDDWREAMTTIPELESCYKEAVNEDLKLAALRVEGGELRTACEKIKTRQEKEFEDWRRRTVEWNGKVAARLRQIGEACSAIVATWDAVPSLPVSADFAIERKKAFDEHDDRLKKLDKVLAEMRAHPVMPKTG
jgi:hypothetical protein